MADLIIMPSLALIAAKYTYLLFGFDGLGEQRLVEPRARHRVHHGHDVDLRGRHRAQRADADRRCFVIELGILVAVLRVGAGQGLRRQHPGQRHAVDRHGSRPTNFGGVSALVRRTAGRRVPLLGLGHRDQRQRGVHRLQHDTRSGRRDLHVRARARSSCRRVRGAGGAAAPTTSSNHSDDVLSVDRSPRVRLIGLRRRRAQAARSSRCSARPRPAARRRSCPRPVPSLSMAMHRAFPPKLGEVDPRHLTPGVRDLVVRDPVVDLVRRPGDRQPRSVMATCWAGRSPAWA